MRIYLNGRFKCHAITGIQRYAHEVSSRLTSQLHICQPHTRLRGWRGHLWEQTVLPLQSRYGLLWSPCASGPVSACRQIVTFHDLFPLEYPHWYSRAFSHWYALMFRRLAMNSAHMIAVSNYTKSRLIQLLRLPQERITVIHSGVDSAFFHATPAEISACAVAQKLPSARYLLYVGSLEPRKNLARLLAAWASVQGELPADLWLVVAGSCNRAVFETAGLGPLPERAHLAGYVPDRHLRGLYAGSLGFLFPSLAEGFGLPPLEAMAAGVPVLTSNVTALPEVCGVAAFYVDPTSVEQIARGIKTIATDKPLRTRLIEAGRCQARRFTWDRTAAQTLQVLAREAQRLGMKRGSVMNRLLDRYLGIPVLYATAFFTVRRELPETLRRIGVLVSPALGDTLINSAVVQDIKSHHPQARLTLFAAEACMAAARLLPCLDEIAILQIANPVAAIRTLRQAKLDLLLDFTQWQRITAFYSAISGAKCRAGFRSLKQHRHYHYDIIAGHSPQVHELENFRRLLRAAAIPAAAPPSLNIPATVSPEFAGASRLIVFHPWASGDRAQLRQWPQDNWVNLASRLNSRGTHFVISGPPSERPSSEELCRQLENRGLRASAYRSADGLLSLGAMLRSSHLVVSVNTGILHLAAISGAPTIALNGPTATKRWGPVGPRVASVEPFGGGGGFLHFGFEFAGNAVDTMSRIRVEDVVKAANQLMYAPLSEAQSA